MEEFMKIRNKRFNICLLLLILTALSLVGCKNNDKEADNSTETAISQTDETESQNKSAFDIEENDGMRKDLTSLELVKLMGNGINLGNTMEAYGRKVLGIDAEVSKYETLWGQPVTTQEMINKMKESGFDSLRIPVAWTNTMDFENGDYTISNKYLDRVEEIINYGLKAGMYVIINDHWDGGWWGMFGSSTEEIRDSAMELYVSMWTQIAERYKDYSDHLIFESANEELGNRLNDRDYAPDSGTLSEDECYELANKINQVFVDTVRGTGGNNEYRFLLIAGYNTDIEKTWDDRFTMPTDTANNKLLLSVHYYTPWGYCGNPSLSNWGSVRDYNQQNELLGLMTKYTDQGYGVVLGEYQVALTEDGSIKNNADKFFNNFLNNCDKYGYVPMLWDCSTYFVRNELAIFDKDIADLFKGRSLSAQSSMTDEEIINLATSEMDKALIEAGNYVEDTAYIDSLNPDKAISWIMFNSGDWATMYSVGDQYDPGAKSEGIIATDVEITGEGTYTVGLDFTGTSAGFANGTAFSALAISNGELLYPGYIINITEIRINDEIYNMAGRPYTTSDDSICTRVNLYNGWVNSIPEEARTSDGDTTDLSPTILDSTTLGEIKTLTVTFEYGPANN
ncbi:MAG: glycoside hydrolase family 5 protein [Anaerolineaceae bacterium]|nr:MAG: glycoside hydrolase family 5 protein [Anaerolineaceae bacterium]